MLPTLEGRIQILVVKYEALFPSNGINSLLTMSIMWKDFLAYVPQAQRVHRSPQEKVGGLWQIRVEGLGLDLVVEPPSWTLTFSPKHEGVRSRRIKLILILRGLHHAAC